LSGSGDAQVLPFSTGVPSSGVLPFPTGVYTTLDLPTDLDIQQSERVFTGNR
jgi:hypothetical protein